MRPARSRPPRLEVRVGESRPAPAPTPELLVERSKLAGAGVPGPGPTEFRRTVERLVLGDRRALGELAPMEGLTAPDAWAAVTNAFGATASAAVIDPARTVAAARAAAARVRAVAATGARIALATSAPASLLTLHLAFAGLARAAGAEVVDLADFGPIRADGRTPRWLRWLGGVAVVSDGRALCDTRDGEAAREWLFSIPRPALVVADGAFAEVACETGIEVVAFAGLDRLSLAVAAARGRGTIVPLHTDRPARAYGVIEDLVDEPGPDPAVDLTAPSPPLDSEL
ncbi:MAG TPA: phosphatase [Acidimicrobiia bacterium]|jgi:hypothetical protein|nr:phosphatase [Acidimicrobiia bacterium]